MATIGTMDVIFRVIDQGTKVLNNVNQALATTNATANRLGIAMGAIGGAFVFREVVGAIRDIGAAMGELAKQGAVYERTMTAFRVMTSITGDEYRNVLSQMRVAARGTVSDMELMLSANKALSLGVAQTGAEMAKLIEVSTVLGRRTGLGQEQSLERLMVGIGRLSPRILDDLGIAVNLTQLYAERTGKLASELSQEEKIHALLNHVMEEGQEIIDQYPEGLDDAASAFERAGASWVNFKNEIANTAPFKAVINALDALVLRMQQSREFSIVESGGAGFAEIEKTIERLKKDLEAIGEFRFSDVSPGSKYVLSFMHTSNMVEELTENLRVAEEQLRQLGEQMFRVGERQDFSAVMEPVKDWAAQLDLAGGQILAVLPEFNKAKVELAKAASGEAVTPEVTEARARVQELEGILRQLVTDYNAAAEALEEDQIDWSAIMRTGQLVEQGALAKSVFKLYAESQKEIAEAVEESQKRVAAAVRESASQLNAFESFARGQGEDLFRVMFPTKGVAAFDDMREMINAMRAEYLRLSIEGMNHADIMLYLGTVYPQVVAEIERLIEAQNTFGTSTEGMTQPMARFAEIVAEVKDSMRDMADLVGGSALDFADWARTIDQSFAIADERRARRDDANRRAVFDRAEQSLKSQILSNVDLFGGADQAFEQFQRAQQFLDSMRQATEGISTGTGELDFALQAFMNTFSAGLQERASAVQEMVSAQQTIQNMGQQFAATLFPEIGVVAFKEAGTVVRQLSNDFNALLASGMPVANALIVIQNEFANLTSQALSTAAALNATQTASQGVAPPLNTAATAAEFLGIAFGQAGEGGYFAAGGIFAAAQEAAAAVGPLYAAASAAIAAKNAMIDQARTSLKSQFLGAIDLFGAGGAYQNFQEAEDAFKDFTSQIDLSKTSVDELDFTLGGFLEDTSSGISGIRDAIRESEAASKRAAKEGASAAKKAAKDAEQAFNELKGKVAGVLQGALDPGVGVDPADFMPRADAINENARRLADIMVNGFKDQSWLEEFKSEVPDIYQALVDSGDPKTTAAQMLQRFQDGLVPELIDKEAAKERVKQMLLGEKNIDALATEIATELAAELGMSLQKTQEATAVALGLEVPSGKQVTVSAIGLDGTSEGDNFVTGFTIAVTARNAEIANTGATIGSAWGEAFLASTRNTVPSGLIDVLFKLVSERMASNSSRQGAIP